VVVKPLATSGNPLTTRPWDKAPRRRRLPAARQALPALAHLRCGDTYTQLAAGFGIGIATVYRCIREAVETLSALAPSLAEAMKTIRMKAFVILDGTLLPIDRIAADTPYHSGKHKRHGMNVQVLTDPFGRLLLASPALPGSTHDLSAAREHGIIEALTGAGLRCWADKAYQGAGGTVRVPFRGRRLKKWKRRHDTTHAKIRCPGEQDMATLKSWRLLRKLCCGTNRLTNVVKAVLVHHMAAIWAGIDAGKIHHHCVAIDGSGQRLLSRRVANDEPELLELLADVLTLSETVTWGIDLADGGAALAITILLNHDQPVIPLP